MGNKFPRPNDINFQGVQNKTQYSFKEASKLELTDKVLLSLCTLQSGNILVSYLFRNEKKLEMKSGIAIYNVPNLRLIQKYTFDSEIKDITYSLDSAIQLINGNIFAICDRLYIFDGENIKDGPKTTSELIDESACKAKPLIFKDPEDKFRIREIKKSARVFLCDFMMEIKEGTVLYTYEHNYDIYLLDIANLETRGTSVYSRQYYEMDIICKSKYYPDNLYVCANQSVIKANSILLIFNIDDFCDKENKQKKPSFSMQISESENVYGLCEYDKKYLLLDTINKGIYIIDMESRQKVAVSASENQALHLFLKITGKKDANKDVSDRFVPVYRNMEKLKDGQVLTVETYFNRGNSSQFFIVDVREQKKVGYFMSSGKFVLIGNYIVSMYVNGRLVVIQICED